MKKIKRIQQYIESKKWYSFGENLNDTNSQKNDDDDNLYDDIIDYLDNQTDDDDFITNNTFKRFLINNNSYDQYVMNVKNSNSDFEDLDDFVNWFHDMEPENYVKHAFLKENTPEGYKYWYNLHYKWIEKLNEMDNEEF